jgi:hypothetical protein
MKLQSLFFSLSHLQAFPLSALAISTAVLSSLPAQAAVISSWSASFNNFILTDSIVAPNGNPINNGQFAPSPGIPNYFVQFSNNGSPSSLASEPLSVSWGKKGGTGAANNVPANPQSRFSVDERTNVNITTTVLPPSSSLNFSEVAQFTHNNFVVGLNTSIGGLTLRSIATLTGAGGSPVFGPLSADFKWTFRETPNTRPCFRGSSSTCDDIFALDTINLLGITPGPLPATNFIRGNFLGVTLSLGRIDDYDYNYVLEFAQNVNTPNSIRFLTVSEIAALGRNPADYPDGLLGFTTRENTRNLIPIRAAITATEVPEASNLTVLSLFGAGICIGVLTKMRKENV